MNQFRDSFNFSARRTVRQIIKKSDLTKAEKEILTALVNLWVHHYGGRLKYIHPGRKHLAKKAGCTVVTVARALSAFRNFGFIAATKRLNGEGQRPTEYTVDLLKIIQTLSNDMPETVISELVEYVSKTYRNDTTNDTPLAYQNDTQSKKERTSVKEAFPNVKYLFGNGARS